MTATTSVAGDGPTRIGAVQLFQHEIEPQCRRPRVRAAATAVVGGAV